jgi:hypothetical protein
MRRKQFNRLISLKILDINRDLSAERPQPIGDATLAWNRAEFMLDRAMCIAAHIHDLGSERTLQV